jgi:hypothetical protein
MVGADKAEEVLAVAVAKEEVEMVVVVWVEVIQAEVVLVADAEVEAGMVVEAVAAVAMPAAGVRAAVESVTGAAEKEVAARAVALVAGERVEVIQAEVVLVAEAEVEAGMVVEAAPEVAMPVAEMRAAAELVTGAARAKEEEVTVVAMQVVATVGWEEAAKAGATVVAGAVDRMRKALARAVEVERRPADVV